MRLLLITSCTGVKSVHHARRLTLADFQQGPAHVARREQELVTLLTPADRLYSGEQHLRLMRGVDALRERTAGGDPLISLDLWILSAGYGLVPANRRLAPYEATFKEMGKAQLRAWAAELQIPRDFRRILAQPYDLGIILLGDEYLAACALDETIVLGGPTLLFCGSNTARRLPNLKNLRTILVGKNETRRFSCGHIGLKGELGKRILERIADQPGFVKQVIDPTNNALGLLDDASSK